jgi:hypothetical protein
LACFGAVVDDAQNIPDDVVNRLLASDSDDDVVRGLSRDDCSLPPPLTSSSDAILLFYLKK